MIYPAYRRMLSKPHYSGVWAFGHTRGQWSSKRDYALRISQPETEVIVRHSEELRIVSDELFAKVQHRLGELKVGPRGPKRRTAPQLRNLVTDCFQCACCSIPGKLARLYQAGAGAQGTRCKRGVLCPSGTIVDRKDAVKAVVWRLTQLLGHDEELIGQVIECTGQHDADAEQKIHREIELVDKKIAGLGRKIEDLGGLIADSPSPASWPLPSTRRKRHTPGWFQPL